MCIKKSPFITQLFLRARQGISRLRSSLRGRRKKGRGRGRGVEERRESKSPQSPSLFPLIPIPNPFDTCYTQAT